VSQTKIYFVFRLCSTDVLLWLWLTEKVSNCAAFCLLHHAIMSVCSCITVEVGVIHIWFILHNF